MKAHSVRTGIPIHGTGTRRLPCLALAVGLVLRKGHMQWFGPRSALHRAMVLRGSTVCTFEIRADAAGPGGFWSQTFSRDSHSGCGIEAVKHMHVQHYSTETHADDALWCCEPHLHSMQSLYAADSLLISLHLHKGHLLAPVGVVIQYPT